jgi:hypothetical protein
MMTKWLSALALLAGLAATAPAAPVVKPTPPHAAPVVVEIRGRLEVLYPPAQQDGDILGCLPPIQYAIEVDGQRFHLNMNRFAGKARELDGQLVIVTGPLELDTVQVTDLRQPIDDALIRYVKMTVAGQLREHIVRCVPETWEIRVGQQTFAVDFANDAVLAVARKLRDRGVILHGRLRDGVLIADSITIDNRPSTPTPPATIYFVQYRTNGVQARGFANSYEAAQFAQLVQGLGAAVQLRADYVHGAYVVYYNLSVTRQMFSPNYDQVLNWSCDLQALGFVTNMSYRG